VSIFSFLIIALGWYEIYKGRNSKKLVRTGLYKYVRHPQYTGIILIITSWLFAWPTLPTLIMWPLLTGVYYRLARKEEKIAIRHFGKDYEKYMKEVPMFLPFWNLK